MQKSTLMLFVSSHVTFVVYLCQAANKHLCRTQSRCVDLSRTRLQHSDGLFDGNERRSERRDESRRLSSWRRLPPVRPRELHEQQRHARILQPPRTCAGGVDHGATIHLCHVASPVRTRTFWATADGCWPACHLSASSTARCEAHGRSSAPAFAVWPSRSSPAWPLRRSTHEPWRGASAWSLRTWCLWWSAGSICEPWCSYESWPISNWPLRAWCLWWSAGSICEQWCSYESCPASIWPLRAWSLWWAAGSSAAASLSQSSPAPSV